MKDLDDGWLKVLFAIVFNVCLLLWFRYDRKTHRDTSSKPDPLYDQFMELSEKREEEA